MKSTDPILVYADWKELHGPQLMGTLFREPIRGEEVLSFEYDADWLLRPNPFLLDPHLHFGSGRQYAPSSRGFGIFLDSAPDRWGRLLIRRKAAMENTGLARPLGDCDYLLAVSDTCRLGGLRFKTASGDSFLAPDSLLSIPPMSSLRQLEYAAQEIEADDSPLSSQEQWLKLILAPGSSLGGARPKCTVVAPDGQLWIAKFPSRSDEYDIGAWECLVHELASAAGLNVAHSRMEAFSKLGHTFITQRFDRVGDQRIHFASAMCLLGYQDGDGVKTGVSYLELADLIERICAHPEKDLEELWKRIVFNCCVHNTDDHLRNHGFILGEKGWRLSPAYDLNPSPWGGGLSLNIDTDRNDCDLDLVRSVAPHFRLSKQAADAFLKTITHSVATWESLAQANGIKRSEIEQMRPAFSTK